MNIEPVRTNINTNLTYIQAKTRADKFVERISDAGNSGKNFTGTIGTALRKNDSYPEINEPDSHKGRRPEITHKMEFDVKKMSKDEPVNLDFPSPKTTAHKFVRQLGNVNETAKANKTENYETDPSLTLKFVDIGDSRPVEKINRGNNNAVLDGPLFGIKEIKKLGLKNDINNTVDSLSNNPQLREMLKAKFFSKLDAEDLLSNIGFHTNQIINQVLGEIVNDLIKQANLAESLLDLSVQPGVEIELAFVEKLRDIIVGLEKSIREVNQLSEERKKSASVKVPIKRFNIKDLKAGTTHPD